MQRLAFLPLLALLAFTACDDDDDPTGNPDVALVRIVNAAPEAANATVNVFEGTTQLGTTVAFQQATTCPNLIELDPGQHTLTFRRVGVTTDLETESFTFLANETYTVVLFGSGASIDAVVFQDDAPTSVPAGNHAVRAINATNTAGDVFVTTPAGAIVAGEADFQNIASGGATTSNNFRNVATADTRFRLVPVGNTTPVRGNIELSNVPASRTTTVVFTEVAAGGGTITAVQLNPCP